MATAVGGGTRGEEKGKKERKKGKFLFFGSFMRGFL